MMFSDIMKILIIIVIADYRDEYEKYFDSLKDGDECLSFKDFIECLC